MMNAEIEKYYPIIGQEFFEVLPDFSEAWLRVEMIDDVWSVGGFYKGKSGGFVYLNKGLETVGGLFREVRNTFKSTGCQPFASATFYLTNTGKFSIDFGYDDVSDFSLSGERRKDWINKNLGVGAHIEWGD